MRAIAVGFLAAYTLGIAAMPATAAPSLTAPTELKETPRASDREDLGKLPPPYQMQEPQAGIAGAAAKAVGRRGCISFPGDRITYRFFAAYPNNYYSVTPSPFFDVVMRVARRLPAGAGRPVLRGGHRALPLQQPDAQPRREGDDLGLPFLGRLLLLPGEAVKPAGPSPPSGRRARSAR